eukprot:NODE_692_length_4692_cov_0.413238.p3 type:complete len:223 gc:universal NODE_692_length_4692_cov_0.413238:4244-3576(-)
MIFWMLLLAFPTDDDCSVCFNPIKEDQSRTACSFHPAHSYCGNSHGHKCASCDAPNGLMEDEWIIKRPFYSFLYQLNDFKLSDVEKDGKKFQDALNALIAQGANIYPQYEENQNYFKDIWQEIDPIIAELGIQQNIIENASQNLNLKEVIDAIKAYCEFNSNVTFEDDDEGLQVAKDNILIQLGKICASQNPVTYYLIYQSIKDIVKSIPQEILEKLQNCNK